jgi:uncharacterized membrane protein
MGQPVSPQGLTFIVYLDGYVYVDYNVNVNQTYPAVNVTLFGESFEDLLVVDEQELPMSFSQTNNTILVNSLGASSLRITYFTQDLTSKLGKIWTLVAEVPINTTVELPVGAAIFSLGEVPELIDIRDGAVILVMPPGNLEVSYIVERRIFQAPDLLLLVLAIILVVVMGIFAYWLVKRRTVSRKERIRKVKVEAILRIHRDLRPEEKEAIKLLAEKGGKAYEAELYERLNIPRTSTWRLIKRLEKMEIVEITKSRRQNIVGVRQQYLD